MASTPFVPGWLSTSHIQRVWTASSDFSSTQGKNQWYYKEWTGAGYRDMIWTADRWQGAFNYTWIGRDFQHPDLHDPVRAWVAPQAGAILITGNVRKNATNGGDGVIATVLKNSTVLWGPQTIAYNDNIGYDINLTTDVRESDSIYFRINLNDTGFHDTTRWNPVITALSPAHFWQTQWFWAAIVSGSGAIVLTGGTMALLLHLRHRRKLAQLELQRVRESERARIARDIHDDLGANLTQIAMLSELAQTDFNEADKARAHISQIFSTARTLTRSLDEIVWAVNPANDTLENFMTYICDFTQDYLSAAGIRCRLDLPKGLPAQPLSAVLRHHLYLVTKEALHNIVKHARASQVCFRLKVQQDRLTLVIEDNGKGFVPSEAASSPVLAGDGLSNMRQRIEEIGGRFEQQSKPGHGTRLELTVPLSAAG